MPFDLALPLYTACGLALVAVMTTFQWPKIRVRSYNKTHGGLRVMEVALILLRAPAVREPAMGKTETPPRGAEFVIYVTLKTGSL
jgi:hypothetical protein